MDRGEKYVQFIQHLTIPKGKRGNTRFKLEPWQREFVAKLFGTLKGDGLRQYRTASLWIPKKNGKTSLAAAIAVASLFLEEEPGGEIYSAANTREQATICFSAAATMIRADPYLRTQAKISDSQKFIKYQKTNSVYKAISADAGDKNGLNPSLVIYDEIAEAPSPELYEKLETGTASRQQPLMLTISTAGDRETIGYQLYQHSCKVRDDPKVDPSFLPVIYEAPENCDWTDLKTWEAANPNWDVSVEPEYARKAIADAQNMPSRVPNLLRYHLNVWVDRSVTWIPSAAWAKGGEALPDLTGRRCFVGVDLASSRDTTAIVLLFPLDDGRFAVLPRFYLPRKSAEERQRLDRVPYLNWARQGHMILTDTPVTDYDRIRRNINELASTYKIEGIAVDPWNATQLLTQLQSDGLRAEKYRLGWVSMAPPSKRFEELVMSHKLVHGNHPVLNWQSGNVVAEVDKAGNVQPSKERSREKIDGIVALVMALGMYMREPGTGGADPNEIYSSQGITFL